MTLDEIRVKIDTIDTQIKPLFFDRMDCSRQVAEAKREMGSDSVFMLERELSIIEKRAADVDPVLYDEYVAFLRHLMSVSRRYQYGILTEMQDKALAAAEEKADAPHRLYRSRSDRAIAGVCGGLADYLHIDSTALRILTLFLILFAGLSIWIYLLMWLIIPEEPRTFKLRR